MLMSQGMVAAAACRKGRGMNLRIRLMASGEGAALGELAVLAWEPVFASFRHILGPEIYQTWARKPLGFSQGMNGPLPLPVSCLGARMVLWTPAPCQSN